MSYRHKRNLALICPPFPHPENEKNNNIKLIGSVQGKEFIVPSRQVLCKCKLLFLTQMQFTGETSIEIKTIMHVSRAPISLAGASGNNGEKHLERQVGAKLLSCLPG